MLMMIRGRLKRFAYSLLRLESVCFLVFKLRFFYLVNLRRRISVFDDAVGVRAPDYSHRMLLKGRTSDRPLRLIRPLSVIDKVKKEGDTLSIGCRFETELLYLVGYEFNPKKIRGLDMISYSPWVDVGNMHRLPYPDSSWDTIILGWVIAYSRTPEIAAEEVIRIARNGAIVAIGGSYYPKEMFEEMVKAGTAVAGVAGTERNTVASLLDLFSRHVGEVFFRHDAADPNAPGVCAVIFSVTK